MRSTAWDMMMRQSAPETEGAGARQPVKRMGDREIEQRRYREPGHSQPGLNLITDTFREDGGRRQNS